MDWRDWYAASDFDLFNNLQIRHAGAVFGYSRFGTGMIFNEKGCFILCQELFTRRQFLQDDDWFRFLSISY
jgi:hypothetical protein